MLQNEMEDIAQLQIKRHWESSPHPYVFFNADGVSMTFLGFNVNPNGDMVDTQTGKILEHSVMPKELQDALIRQGVSLNEDYDNLSR